MDLSKLPEKATVLIVLIIVLFVGFLFGVSYLHNGPVFVNGKEFGLGSDELQKRTVELGNCRNESSKALSEVRRLLVEAKTENQLLKKANAVLLTQQQDRARQDAALWFPIDDVQFLGDGTFSTQNDKRGRGKWSSPENELTLQIERMDHPEVVLRTNLPPPENKIRIWTGHGIFISFSKYDYKLSVQEFYSYSNSVTVRVERRSKQQGL